MPRIRLPSIVLALAAGLCATLSHAADSLYDQLEQEKQADQIYKAYFPDLATARKAAISFHAQLLESNYAAGYLILELDAADLDRLRPFGFRFERATEFIRRRNDQLTRLQIQQARQSGGGTPLPQAIPGYACYETVEETFAAGDSLIAARPTLAAWVDAGDSWQKTQGSGGYDMRVLKITNSAVAPAGGAKPKLFVQSAIHAREYTTAPLTLEFARWLINGYGTNADATWIVDHHETHLLLQTNPDGRKRAEAGLSWRKNVDNNHCANSNNRGVDLNRNFSFSWNTTNGQGSSGNQCSLTYRGPSPGSEPEVQAVQNYVRSLWPDRRGPGSNDAAPADTSGVHMDIHSYSQLVLWPWGDVSTPAPNGVALQTMGRRLAWFNGYTPQQSIGLYPTDGTSDAVSYGELGVAAFTIELGTAFFESCSSYNSTTKPNNLPALIYAAKVVRTPYLTPAGPDVTSVTLAGDASGAGVAAGTAVALSAAVTSTRFNNSNGAEPMLAVAGAQYTIDTPPWQADAVPVALSAADGGFDGTTEAAAGSINTSALAPGQHTVYMRGRVSSGAWGPVSAVFLNITNPPPPTVLGEIEPNDTLDTAQAVTALPALINGTMTASRSSRSGDFDHYRVVLPAGQTLTATLTPVATADHDLEILAASGAVLASSRQGVGQAETVNTTNSSGAAITLYVRASYVSGGIGATFGGYTLALSQAGVVQAAAQRLR